MDHDSLPHSAIRQISAADFSPEVIRSYSRTTLPSANAPAGVVYPTCTEEVQQLVQLAREQRFPLYPLSRGRNWGYGDRNAPGPGYLIVDLSRMNRIHEVNSELGYVVIEPGVTPGQLYAHLQKLGGTLWMDANGAGPDTSLVGNILERGFGHTPLGERASTVCGMEVVLGTGEILHTGFGHYPNARAQYTYRHGIGPSLDGLFFQSNYGVVTRLGLWLMPAPEAFSGFRCVISDERELEPLIDRLAWLRRQGVVRSCMHVLNPLRALMKNLDYPWHDTQGRRPVSADLRRQWRERFEVPAWSASGAIYGPSELVEAGMAVVRRKLHPFTVHELSDTALERLHQSGNTTLAESLRSSAALLKGIPAEGILRTAAWRSRQLSSTSSDPLDNGAGLMWVVPTLPATGADAVRVEGLLRGILESHGFDAPITLTLIHEKTITCTSNISFNREDPDDVRAAEAAYEECVRRSIEAGYPPYRSGIGGYGLLHRDSSFWKTTARLREVLDPDGVISPGRYLR